MSAKDVEDRLYMCLAPRKYLENPEHHLHEYVKDIREAISAKPPQTVRATDLLNRLEAEIEMEKQALERAFKLFDNSGKDALTRSDLKNMNRYLGFPSDDRDIDKLMEVIDEDKSGTVSYVEFDAFVGNIGGSAKLFEERTRRISMRLGGSTPGSSAGSEGEDDVFAMLRSAGIDQEAQAYWKMVVPWSELVETSKLVKCQREALKHIRTLAKRNHQVALPKLQARINKMKIPEDQLWLALAWIRELAPVIVHVHLDKMLEFMDKDSHYRNQFETSTSGGLLKPDIRKKWEKDLFGGCYEKASGFERPKYGVQNVMNDPRGVVKCKQYGESYFILKNKRLACTFSPEDSANLKAEKLAVLDFYAHVLHEYSDDELKETLAVANSAESALLGDSDKVGSMKYKEAQIHGEIDWKMHVERLVVATKHRSKSGDEDKIRAVCRKHGWKFSWMDLERDRMQREEMHKLGGAEWTSRLKKLQEEGGDIEVPEGFCKVGCGRRVSPGVTRAGKAFTTCCRGCIMGFGHDSICGSVDASKVGPGLCKMGCGRKVAPGRDRVGRALTTCCRGCAKGMDHDRFCQNSAEAAPGMCRMLCGRPVAVGATPSGKAYDTCCRGCARGFGHSDDCAGGS